MEIGARYGNLFRLLVAVAATLGVVLILSAQTKVQPSSHITAIDPRTGVVSAKVNASGEDFQFTLSKPALLSTLKIGQGVYANFQTKQVSLNGKDVVGSIVRVGPPDGPPGPAAPSKPSNTPLPPQPQMSPKASGGSAPAGAVSSAAGTSPACCGITSVDTQTRLAAAKVNSTGQNFEFSVPNSVPVQNLHAGQPVWANFKARKVSLDGETTCCDIVSFGSSPPREIQAGGTPDANASQPGSPAGVGQPKVQNALVAPGGSAAGLKGVGPTINLPTPPQIQNFGVFPGPIPGGQEDVGQVVLTGVPASGATVQLSSNLPSVASVPPQVQVPGSGPSAGSAVIVVNTSPVSKATDVTLSAQIVGSSQVLTTKLTVRPPQLSIFQCSPTVISGTPIACKVWLDGPAPGSSVATGKPGVIATAVAAEGVGGPAVAAPAMQVQISTNNSQVASVPGGTISIPAGADSANFQIPTTAYPEPVDVVISASNSGSTPENASVTLTAAAIRSFGCGSGGNSSCEYVPDYIIPNIMMTFSGPTPAGFITVSSSSGAANICNGNSCGPSQGVPQQAGAKSEAVFVFADAVAVPTTVTLSATDPLSKLVKTVQVKINPPTPAGMAFYSQSGTPLTSINNVLAGGQQVITQVLMNGYAPEGGITFDVKYSASDAAGNPLPGAVSGPAQFTYGPLPQFDTPCSAVFYAPCFFTTVQPCEVNAPCKVSVTVGSATGTLYVNP